MSSGTADASVSGGERLGGARADFVGSLGRKVSDTRGLLSVLDDDPTSKLARDELRRRLHALCSGARLLRFDAMAHSLQESLAVLDRAALLGELGEAEIGFVGQVLDDLPALAWSEAATREAVRPVPAEEPVHPTSDLPITVLVVGGDSLAEMLRAQKAVRGRALECECTEDIDTALQLARAYAPDVALIDADIARASDLVGSLIDDPLTEPVPILVVGTFLAPEDAARLMAVGAARVFAKPLSSDAFRAALEEILESREDHTVRLTLGEPTLEQLADRLADELRRALLDSVDRPARSCRIPLGEGADVLGALWGAIARVQEIISQRTGGAVRFDGDAPDGAIALAPWLHHEVPASDRLAGRGRGGAADVRLKGRRIVVADDDPGVTWFISDLLRAAGCEVFEALDGTTALALAYRMQPELVVSDILMPGLDGFALSRALRRDVALRDTPVILLSWKEDLLQRVRELGASAAAYMRKESDSRAILARVREVLRPRARIEIRLRGEGEVRGRLDELSPRLLLDLVCAIRTDARVAVRDATFLYEIDVRGGAPRKATRTASDGGYQSGERALASLLGVGAGRFVVSPTAEHVRGDLTGSLFEQLARPIAVARGALAATTGAAVMEVDRVTLDGGSLDEYLRATPDPARALIRRLADGASPRQMLLGGDVSPSLLEDVLADLAARGAVRGVQKADGSDLLTPAVEAAAAIVRAAGARTPSAPSPKPYPSALVPAASGAARGSKAPSSSTPPAYETFRISDSPPVAPDAAAGDDDEGSPSSLEDAVMREISDRSPFPGPAYPSAAAQLPPLIEPSALRPRSSNPPAADVEPETTGGRRLPSIAPDAMVPEEGSGEGPGVQGEPAPAEVDVVMTPPITAHLDVHPPLAPPSETPPAGEPNPPAPAASPFVSPFAPPPGVDAAEGGTVRATALDRSTVVGKAARKDVSPETSAGAVPTSVLPRKSSFPWGVIIAFLVLIFAALVAVRVAGLDSETLPLAPIPKAPASATDDVPPRGVDLPPGSGYVEVLAPSLATVLIDGTYAGLGPTAARAVGAGYHDVSVEQGGRESKAVVEVRAGKMTRVRLAATP